MRTRSGRLATEVAAEKVVLDKVQEGTFSQVRVLEVETEMSSPAPISINDAYFSFHGKRVLTKAGEKYKAALAAAISRSSFDWKTGHDAIYKQGGWSILEAHIFFEVLRNPAWKPGGSTTKAGNLREPWKKQDADNYVKLLIDAVVAGSGIDDCNNMGISVYKHEDPLRPRVHVKYSIWKGQYV